MGDGAKHIAVCKLTMSNTSSDSLSYTVPEILTARASLNSAAVGMGVGTRRVAIGGGMKGLMGVGLGMRGDTIETRSGSLVRRVHDFCDSNRMFASRLRRRLGD